MFFKGKTAYENDQDPDYHRLRRVVSGRGDSRGRKETDLLRESCHRAQGM